MSETSVYLFIYLYTYLFFHSFIHYSFIRLFIKTFKSTADCAIKNTRSMRKNVTTARISMIPCRVVRFRLLKTNMRLPIQFKKSEQCKNDSKFIIDRYA